MRCHRDITFQVSCPYTPEQNSLAERKHRHVVELDLANMFHASIPLKYWSYIFTSVVFVINRLPSVPTSSISPFEKLFAQKPDYTMLHTLGCTCFPLLRPYNTHKLQPRSEKCVFLGYFTTHKGYTCLHIPSDRVYIFKHVNFVENELPFFEITSIPSQQQEQTSPSTSLIKLPPPITQHEPSPITPQELPQNTSDETQQPEQQHLHTSPPHSPPPNIPQIENNPAPSHPMLTRTKTRSLKPKTYPDHCLYNTSSQTASTPDDPTCFSQASKHTAWRAAMADELTALTHNLTWDLVPLPSGAHVVGAKWLYKTKYKSDGSIQRHKARLVAKGYSQQEGIDYFETFSPVVKPATIQIVLTIALSRKWYVHQLDVNNAFLHGDLQDTVYMEQPPGFVDPQFPTFVCKLKKSLYWLKTSPTSMVFKTQSFSSLT